MLASTEKKRFEGFEFRIRLVAVGLVVAFLILVGRLWYLQIICGEEYAAKSDKNRLRFEWLRSRRGLIYGPDLNVVLADSRAAWDLVVVPNDCTDPADPDRVDRVCRLLATLTGVDGDALRQDIRKAIEVQHQPFQEITVKRDVNKTELIRVSEFSHALPGVYTDVRQQRRYPYGQTAGQLLGYIGEIGPDELKKRRSEYKMGDLIGQAGLERRYEDLLRGKDGQLCVSVYASGVPIIRTDASGNPHVEGDSYGRQLKEETEFRRDPAPGQPIFLTLDVGLQAEAERLLAAQVGAVVVLDASTGAVLALASSPGYDPNVFVTRGRNRERSELLHAPTKPMRNRAYQEVYPPGSVFKVLLATAALEEGVISVDTGFSCGGYYHLPGVERAWRCWRYKYGGHGGVSVVDALAYSCDVFFYNAGNRLGVDRIKDWCSRLGLGELTGIDLPIEETGVIPSRQWKQDTMRPLYPNNPEEWKWYPGETLNLSIGQGGAATTPLQNAVLMAAIINGGRRVYPYLNKAKMREPSEPFISEQTLRIVQEGMQKCVEKDTPPRGTGIEARIAGMTVLGKTGTAQAVAISQYKRYEKEEDIPYELRDHALFIAGVPDGDPPIAVSVIVEHGLHGSSAAAPIARQVIEYFYNKDRGDNVHVAQRRTTE